MRLADWLSDSVASRVGSKRETAGDAGPSIKVCSGLIRLFERGYSCHSSTLSERISISGRSGDA